MNLTIWLVATAFAQDAVPVAPPAPPVAVEAPSTDRLQPLIELPEARLDRDERWLTPGEMRDLGMVPAPIEVDLPDVDGEPDLYYPVENDRDPQLDTEDEDMDLGADLGRDDPIGEEKVGAQGFEDERQVERHGSFEPPERFDGEPRVDADDRVRVRLDAAERARRNGAARTARPIEITVFGPVAESQARAAVVREIERLGYRAVEREGGRVVFKPPETWMGRVRLEEDGTLTFGRPVVAMRNAYLDQRPGDEETILPPGQIPNKNFGRTPQGNVFYDNTLTPDGGTSAGVADNDVEISVPPLSGSFVLLPSRRYLVPVREHVLEQVGPYLEEYRQIRRNSLTVERMGDVRASLTALWTEGIPIQGGGPSLASWADRREAALRFWATRLDNPEGLLVTEVVEEWLQDVVMPSDHPVTPEEEAEAEAMRPDHRELYLTR